MQMQFCRLSCSALHRHCSSDITSFKIGWPQRPYFCHSTLNYTPHADVVSVVGGCCCISEDRGHRGHIGPLLLPGHLSCHGQDTAEIQGAAEATGPWLSAHEQENTRAVYGLLKTCLSGRDRNNHQASITTRHPAYTAAV
jgi:hypothetical protein